MKNQDVAGYRALLRTASRFTKTESEAQDLAQDVLLIAIERGVRDWSAPEHQPWLCGVVRKRAALVVRTALRRRMRERAWGNATSQVQSWGWHPTFLCSLPPSLRAVATLASADLTAAEIRWLLRLSPTALRTRLSALRRAIRTRNELPTIEAARAEMALGTRRGPILAALKRSANHVLGTHDADGHVILFEIVPHKSGLSGN